jgi:hypothetical protein
MKGMALDPALLDHVVGDNETDTHAHTIRQSRSSRVTCASQIVVALGRAADARAGLARHEQVLRLEVSVNDPFGVGRGEAAADLDRVAQRLARGQLALRDRRPQRRALEQLRDDVGRVALRMS